MIGIELYGGESLAKVLHYYGLPSDEDKIVCPFHDDLNPSMKIDFETGTAYCFGCNEAHDALSFVKRVEDIDDDLQAAIKLAHIIISKKSKNIKFSARASTKHDLSQCLIEAKDYYYNLKTTNWLREDSDESQYMVKRGFKKSTLNMCGAKYTYNKSYPIVFPMLDNGEFKGWVCRTTLKTIEKRRKYLYNTGFSRRSTLCGTYTKGKPVVVCEGYMDMLKFKQFGLKNVVAILGWKITSEQINKLKEMGITHVISALDMDKCGNKGTEYLKKFFKVTRFKYPKGVKDAGDMNQKQFSKSYKLTKLEVKGDKLK